MLRHDALGVREQPCRMSHLNHVIYQHKAKKMTQIKSKSMQGGNCAFARLRLDDQHHDRIEKQVH